MKIMKFTGKNFQEAFMKMKRELGEDAIIINSRKLPENLQTNSKLQYEVTAILDEKTLKKIDKKDIKKAQSVQPDIKQKTVSTSPEIKDVSEKNVNIYENPKLKTKSKQKEFLAQLQQFSHIEDIKDELSGLKSSLDGMMELIKDSRLPALPEVLKRLYKKLVDMEVQENLAKTIVQTILAKLNEEEINNKETLSIFLKKIFSSLIKIAAPVEKTKSRKQQIIAIVGPTGVGKTTTVAKIAANCKILHGKKVGIISADTFRIAAIEQIQTFANIAGLPMEVVYDASEMENAVRELRDMDIILIDTVGRSQKKSEQLLQIKEFIDKAHAQQVHLVLSLTSSTKNLLNVAEQFSILNPNRYIFSKLDEVSGAGNLLNICYKMKTPISYITTGQNVPDDILLPDVNTLSRLLLYGLN